MAKKTSRDSDVKSQCFPTPQKIVPETLYNQYSFWVLRIEDYTRNKSTDLHQSPNEKGQMWAPS